MIERPNPYLLKKIGPRFIFDERWYPTHRFLLDGPIDEAWNLAFEVLDMISVDDGDSLCQYAVNFLEALLSRGDEFSVAVLERAIGQTKFARVLSCVESGSFTPEIQNAVAKGRPRKFSLDDIGSEF